VLAKPRKIALPAYDGGVDGDRDLRSPKMLPTNPTNPSSPGVGMGVSDDDPFSILAKKLEKVAMDPKAQVPVVLMSQRALAQEGELGVSMGKVGTEKGGRGLTECGTSGGKVCQGVEKEKEEEVDEEDEKIPALDDILMKTRKSLNFGSQLGSLK